MTNTPSDSQIADIAARVPTFEMLLLDAAARTREPGLPTNTLLGLLQAAAGYALVIRGYRDAAGLDRAWPEELWRVLSDLSDLAQRPASDAGLTTQQVLRFYRVGQSLAQSVLLALPRPPKKVVAIRPPAAKAPAPQPVWRGLTTIVEPPAMTAPSLHQALRQAVAAPTAPAARAA